MNMAPVDLVAVREALARALGLARVSDRPLDRLAYGHDAWPVALKAPGDTRWQPDLVAWPAEWPAELRATGVVSRRRRRGPESRSRR